MFSKIAYTLLILAVAAVNGESRVDSPCKGNADCMSPVDTSKAESRVLVPALYCQAGRNVCTVYSALNEACGSGGMLGLKLCQDGLICSPPTPDPLGSQGKCIQTPIPTVLDAPCLTDSDCVGSALYCQAGRNVCTVYAALNEACGSGGMLGLKLCQDGLICSPLTPGLLGSQGKCIQTPIPTVLDVPCWTDSDCVGSANISGVKKASDFKSGPLDKLIIAIQKAAAAQALAKGAPISTSEASTVNQAFMRAVRGVLPAKPNAFYCRGASKELQGQCTQYASVDEACGSGLSGPPQCAAPLVCTPASMHADENGVKVKVSPVVAAPSWTCTTPPSTTPVPSVDQDSSRDSKWSSLLLCFLLGLFIVLLCTTGYYCCCKLCGVKSSSPAPSVVVKQIPPTVVYRSNAPPASVMAVKSVPQTPSWCRQLPVYQQSYQPVPVPRGDVYRSL